MYECEQYVWAYNIYNQDLIQSSASPHIYDQNAIPDKHVHTYNVPSA